MPCLVLLTACPTVGRSAAGSFESSFISSLTLPFLPRNCACAARIACSSASGWITSRNSSPRRASFAISSVVSMSVHQTKTAALAEPPSSRRSRSSLRGDDLLERDRIADRDLGEHLAVELDARLVELAHQLAVADAERTRRRVDALDPQRA